MRQDIRDSQRSASPPRCSSARQSPWPAPEKGKSLVRGVHTEVSLIKADGTTNSFVVDRGQVTAESDTSVTLKRKDGPTVTLGLNADTKVRGDIQVDKGAVVFSRGGTAFAVLAPRSAQAAPGTPP